LFGTQGVALGWLVNAPLVLLSAGRGNVQRSKRASNKSIPANFFLFLFLFLFRLIFLISRCRRKIQRKRKRKRQSRPDFLDAL